MGLYYYKGKSIHGEEISGLLNTDSKHSVARRIKQQGFVPVKIREVKTNSPLYILMSFFQRAGLTEMAVFCRQFAAMTDAGADILESLNFIAKQTQNRKLRQALVDVNWQIKCGLSLADALRNHPYVFSEMFVAMVEAGEASGNLSEVFNLLSDYYFDIARRREKIKNAMVYPCILVITSLVVVNFLTIKVLPVYANIFSSFGAKLPKTTQILMWINSHIGQIFAVSWLLFLKLLLLIFWCKKSENLSYQIDKLKLSFPLIGQFLKRDMSYKVIRVLYILVSSGVPILEAIELTANSVKNRVMIRKLQKMKLGLNQGKSLAEVLDHEVFPSIMTKLIATGEESGVLEKTLGKVASIFEDEVDILQERLMALVEPVIIIVLTIVIGFIVVSTVMPMFEIYRLF